MHVPTFYVETSVWGSLAPRQPRDRKQLVRRLLSLLDGVRGVCVISASVLMEIARAEPADAAAIREHIDKSRPVVHPVSEAMEAPAQAYLDGGVLPERRRTDALHVAAATCIDADYLVSWNHRHMTRPMKRLQYEAVNRLNGYIKTPLICNPVEACDELRGG
jgi:hypothetical protein